MSNLTNSIETLFNKMEGFISSKTVIGEPINFGDIIIVPLVDVSVGVGAGSFIAKEKEGENGGGGLGAKINPTAVLVIQNGAVQLVDVKGKDNINKLIDMVPGLISKFDFGNKFKKDNKDEEDEEYNIEDSIEN